MVNVRPDRLVYELDEDFVSGETLAAKLGVSRVAIHKRVKKMRAAGYPVESGPSGYRFVPGAPAPKPLLRRYQGGLLTGAYYFGEVASTQDVLRELAAAGAAEGALVVAESQRAGRGRRGRSWLSPAGGLYFSLLLRPQFSPDALPLVSLAAGAALARAGDVGGLKWPNDLLAPDGRKLAGVLTEAELLGEEVRCLILGVGLNFAPPELEGAAGLAEFSQRERVGVLARFLAAFERLYASLPEPEAVLEAWSRYDYTTGREVRIHVPGGEVTGVAESVEEDGSLLVRTPAGKRVRVSAGDVELIGGFS
ncbi:biotin--[acetyl-CoA-carboxylase] ligase [Oceanithermus sp.]